MFKERFDMITLDYKSVFCGQYENVVRSRHNINMYNSFSYLIPDKLFNNSIRKLNNNTLIPQLLVVKAAAGDLVERKEKYRDCDLSNTIHLLDRYIAANIDLYERLQVINLKEEFLKNEQLCLAVSVLMETVEHLYSILRLLKKVNKKIPSPNNDMAKLASEISTNSLERILHAD